MLSEIKTSASKGFRFEFICVISYCCPGVIWAPDATRYGRTLSAAGDMARSVVQFTGFGCVYFSCLPPIASRFIVHLDNVDAQHARSRRTCSPAARTARCTINYEIRWKIVGLRPRLGRDGI